MATGLRRRTVCQSCSQRCQVTPLEVMLRGGRGWRGHWVWSQRTLCPLCQLHLVELLGELELQAEESRPDQGLSMESGTGRPVPDPALPAG